MENKMNVEYYHFESVDSGNRYFRVDWLNEKIVQIVLSSGRAKKGRPHQLGIVSLTMSSFRGSYYHWYFLKKNKKFNIKTVLKHSTKNQFDQALVKCINLLQL